MKRYEEPGDAVPHEVNALVLSESETCFDRPFPELFETVRSSLPCDKLRFEEYYHDLSDLSNRELLVQHGVWVLHGSCLADAEAYPELHYYLDTRSYPDGTIVVAVVDETSEREADDLAATLRDRYDGDFAVLTSHDRFVGFLRGALAAINPCSPAGLEYILRWNNDVCDDIEIV